MSKEKRLGRGLEALLGKVAAAQSNVVDAAEFAPDFAVKTAAKTTADASQTTAASLTTAASSNDASAPTIVSFVQRVHSAPAARAVQNVSNPSDAVPSPGSPSSSDADSGSNSDAKSNASRSVAAQIEDEKDRVLAQFSAGRAASEIPIESVDRNPFQPRLDFDPAEMAELASSIAQHGMIQPIVVRQKGDRFEIVAGERRFRAAKQAGWKNVPAHFLTVDDREMAELALTENVQRRDLNPIEKAVAFRNYLDSYGGTHEELAKRLDLDRSTVTNLMRLLDLPDEIQKMTRQGEITQGHARALLPLEEWDQLELARRIVEEKLSVRQTETIVQEFLAGTDLLPPKKDPKKTEENPRVRDLEQQFRTWLGMKVKLTSNEKGKGKLVVQFNSNDEFERVYQALKPRDF